MIDPFIKSPDKIALSTAVFMARTHKLFAEIKELEKQYIDEVTGIVIGDIVMFFHKDHGKNKYTWFVGTVKGFRIQPALTDVIISVIVGVAYISGMRTVPYGRTISVALRSIVSVLRPNADSGYVIHDPKNKGVIVNDVADEDLYI